MPLFKFCKPEHHIDRAASLKVGTLHGYRAIENPELRDEAEGRYDFTLSFDGEVRLERRVANVLLSGMISFGGPPDELPRIPGGFSAHVEKLTVVSSAGDGVTVSDTRVRISRDVPNSLVFCMSQLSDAAQCPFDGYADHWSIRDDAAEEFGRRLGGLIFQQAKLEFFGPDLASLHSAASIKALQLAVQHRPVIYRDRTLHVTQQTLPSFDELMRLILDIPFVKPERYAAEHEYRFTFSLHDGAKVYPPSGDLLLPLSFIHGLV